jgi:hypothetical protein
MHFPDIKPEVIEEEFVASILSPPHCTMEVLIFLRIFKER